MKFSLSTYSEEKSMSLFVKFKVYSEVNFISQKSKFYVL